MAGPSSSGLEVLLSTLQTSGDIESTLNILNVLDELLSAGTDRRIHYMISKGGSEALLGALVNVGQNMTPGNKILLPLLHLLAKVGHRDRKIGQKAEMSEAVLLTLRLLRQNVAHARTAAACLWVLRVFCSSVSTATLLGQNHCLDVVFKLISPHTAKNTRTVKAAIDALAALLCSKSNSRCAATKGYVSGLLKLYEDWHHGDAGKANIAIRRALLHCLHHATNTSAGRASLVAEGGIYLLFSTTQTCLASTDLECLVEPSVQLMRKCFPKSPIPLSSEQCAYSFPLPGTPGADWDVMPPQDCSGEDEDSEEDNDISDCREEDDDLETDVNKLRSRPKPDRPLEQLGQYVRLCPELQHDFQDVESSSDRDDSSDDEASPAAQCSKEKEQPLASDRQRTDMGEAAGPRAGTLRASDFHSRFLSSSGGRQEGPSAIDRLLERHKACIPHHDARVYSAMATATKSVAGYSVLAFPDFWGHLPPQRQETMAARKAEVQRSRVIEDIKRMACPGDVIDRVVFDLEDTRPQLSPEPDVLQFYSRFESGNLRKAIQVRSHEYDLILNADINTGEHHQWFYFEVSGMKANIPYRFNIINCEKSNSQFNYGMQPVLFSVREALEGRPSWVRAGSQICYYRNHYRPHSGPKGSSYYTLTFSVTFQHSEDVCYLAYHYPYTYSALQAHLQMLQQSVDPRKVYFNQQSLCSTLAGNPCPLVTVTACPVSHRWSDLHQLRNRPFVVLTARVHPGESNASWVMKGSLEFLCSDDPLAECLREAYIFKIIPMLNPDGVINGSHRCSLNGGDLNRQWMKPDPALSPTIYHAKGFLYYLNSIGRSPLVFCDYHGHSRKKNVFLYGCSVKETLWQSGSPVDTSTLKEDPGYRSIPKTLDRIAPAFSFNSCHYTVEKSREATARVVVWREMGVLRSYTMESTYNGCNQGVYKGLQIGTKELEETGAQFCQSLLSLRKNTLLHSRKLISHASAVLDLDDGLMDHKSHNCFEDDEPECAEKIEYLHDCCSEHNRDELDAEVDGNATSSDEDEDEEGSVRSASPPYEAKLSAHLLRPAAAETRGVRRSNITNGEHVGESGVV